MYFFSDISRTLHFFPFQFESTLIYEEFKPGSQLELQMVILREHLFIIMFLKLLFASIYVYPLPREIDLSEDVSTLHNVI